MNEVYKSIDIGYYDKAFRKHRGIQSKWHHLKFEALKRIILEEKAKEILDIACGPGTFIGSLPSDLNCIGIDIVEEQILYAQNFYGCNNKTFIVSDVIGKKIPFANNSFDCISCIEFFEHITVEEIIFVLKEVYRCLKPGGILIATTPNYQLSWKLLESVISVIGKVDYRPQHITRFNLSGFRDLIKKSGFEIRTARKYLYISPFIALLSWKFSSLFFEFEYNHFKNLGNSLLAVAEKKLEK